MLPRAEPTGMGVMTKDRNEVHPQRSCPLGHPKRTFCFPLIICRCSFSCREASGTDVCLFRRRPQTPSCCWA